MTVTSLTPARRLSPEDGLMDTRTGLLIALIVGGLGSGWHRWTTRPVHPPDGEIAPGDPVQTDIKTTARAHLGRWTLTPRATYDIEARILSREDYRFDTLADLVPEDLALGWGPMSDNRILAAFDISQSVRFYTWHLRTALPVPREVVISHSANTNGNSRRHSYKGAALPATCWPGGTAHRAPGRRSS